MRKCKTKAIQENLGTFSHIPAYSDRFMHNQTYPTIIQTYSKLYVILAYSEPTYIENTCTFRTRGILWVLAYSKPRGYSESCQTSTMLRSPKMVNDYKCFCNISFSHSLLHEINIIILFNACLIFIPKVYQM